MSLAFAPRGAGNPNDLFLTVEGYLSAAGAASMGAPNQMWLTDGAGTYSAVTFTDIVTDVAVSHGAVVVSIPRGWHTQPLPSW